MEWGEVKRLEEVTWDLSNLYLKKQREYSTDWNAEVYKYTYYNQLL